MIKKYYKKMLLISLTVFQLIWAQTEQPYPPLNLVNIPTAGTLPRGSFTVETLLGKDGAFTPKLSVGFSDNFSFGVSFGIQNLIGDNKPTLNKTTPEVQIKYRVFDETEKMPALVYGLDTQGRGVFHKVDSISWMSDSTRILNRYDQKAWGIYMVLSKNWSFLGNLGAHAGLCKSLLENDDGDNDLNVFVGFDKELNRSFSLLVEYDTALNDNIDNDYQLNDISFGKGKGYLNAGLRWTISSNIMMEINFNDINQNAEAEYTNREIKIMYSESF